MVQVLLMLGVEAPYLKKKIAGSYSSQIPCRALISKILYEVSREIIQFLFRLTRKGRNILVLGSAIHCSLITRLPPRGQYLSVSKHLFELRKEQSGCH